MDDCPRKGRWIGGCKFEPRYDQIIPASVQEMLGRASGRVSLSHVEGMTVPVYVRDVCVRCGRTVEREDSRHG